VPLELTEERPPDPAPATARPHEHPFDLGGDGVERP
jgi:hypothetical protein